MLLNLEGQKSREKTRNTLLRLTDLQLTKQADKENFLKLQEDCGLLTSYLKRRKKEDIFIVILYSILLK